MARIPYATRETVTPELAHMFDTGAPANITGLLANAPANAVLLAPYLVSVLSAQELDARLRELCILYVARLCDCDYEWVQHERVALAVGVCGTDIEQLRRLENPAAAFAPPWSDALELCRQLVTTHSAEPDTVRRLCEALGPRQLMELMLASTTYLALAAIMNACAIDPEAPISPETARELAEGRLGASRQPAQQG